MFICAALSRILPIYGGAHRLLAWGKRDRTFWRPVSERIPASADHVLVGWPGFVDTPSDPSVKCLADLVSIVDRHLDRPAALVAQSMGGVVAVLAALHGRANVHRLVLTATSGGIDMRPFRPYDELDDGPSLLRDIRLRAGGGGARCLQPGDAALGGWPSQYTRLLSPAAAPVRRESRSGPHRWGVRVPKLAGIGGHASPAGVAGASQPFSLSTPYANPICRSENCFLRLFHS